MLRTLVNRGVIPADIALRHGEATDRSPRDAERQATRPFGDEARPTSAAQRVVANGRRRADGPLRATASARATRLQRSKDLAA